MGISFVWLALGAAVAFATANILDKVLMSGFIDHPLVKTGYYGVLAPVVGLPVFLLGPVDVPPLPVMVTAFVAGAAFLGAVALVMWGMKLGKVSRVALVKQTNPLFVVPFSFLLLGEVLTSTQYLGFGLLLTAGMLAALEHPEVGVPRFSLNKPFVLVFLASPLAATSFVLVKYLLQFTNVWTVFYGQQIGMLLVAPLLLGARQDVRAEAAAIARDRGTTLVLIAVSAAVFAAGTLSFNAAVQQTSPAIVAAINTINPMFTVLLVLALQRVGVDHFEEHMTWQEIAVKAAATLLFVAGVFLVK